MKHQHARPLLRAAAAVATGIGCFASSQAARATLAVYEPFNYPVNDMVNGSLTPNTGLAGIDGQALTAPTLPAGYTAPNGNPWFSTNYSAHTGSYSRANDALVNGNDLIVPGLYKPSVTNAVNFGGAGSSPRLAFAPIDNDSINGSAVPAYYSFAFRINDLSTTAAAGGLIGGFNNTIGSQSTNPATVGAALFAKTSGLGFVLGILEQGIDATQATYDTTVLSYNTTYFVVGKYTINGTFNTGGAGGSMDDTAEIWINPSSATFAGSDPAGSLVALNQRVDVPTNMTGNHTIQTFLLRQGNNPTGNHVADIIFDELRVGTTYADVTPVPEPSGMAVLALAAAGLSSRRGRHRSVRNFRSIK